MKEKREDGSSGDSQAPQSKAPPPLPSPRPPAKAAWSLIPQAVVTDNTPPPAQCVLVLTLGAGVGEEPSVDLGMGLGRARCDLSRVTHWEAPLTMMPLSSPMHLPDPQSFLHQGSNSLPTRLMGADSTAQEAPTAHDNAACHSPVLDGG